MLKTLAAVAAGAVLAFGGYSLTSSAEQSSSLTVANVAGYMKGYITVEWAPTALASSYALKRDGVQVSTAGPAATSTRFYLQPGTHTLTVVAQLTAPTTSTVATTSAPTTTVAPPPTTTTTPAPSASFRVGVIGNVAGWGAPMQANMLAIGTKLIREDRGDFALSWAQANGITDICIIAMSASSAGANCPVVELDNEPYNSSTWDVGTWARNALAVAQQVHAAHPSATILLPVGPPWNNGNVQVNGVWTDTVLAINAAAPGIWQYVNGIAIHPYSQPAGPVPGRFPVLDKWRSNLKAIGHDLPFWVTEIGWPTGGQNWPPPQTEQQQADYLGQFIDTAKARGDVRAVLVYDAQDYGPRDTDSEHYFGLLHVDGTKKPAWSVVQSRIAANP